MSEAARSTAPDGGSIRLEVVRDDGALGRRGLDVLHETLRRRPDSVISLTTGRTPAGLYRALREEQRAGRIDLSRARFVSSEEYAGIGADDEISLFGWLRAVVLDPCGIDPASVLRLVGDAPDLARECRRFDAALDRMGGLDLVVQTIGTNGHFGFNEPGSAPDAPSRVAALAPSTLRVNAAYWRDGGRVPSHGLTMGLGPTLRARHVLLLACGAPKAAALAQALHGPIDATVPCSLLRLARRLTVMADEGAAGRLRAHDGTAFAADRSPVASLAADRARGR